MPKFDWSTLVPDETIWLKTKVEDRLIAPKGPYRKGPDGLYYMVTPFGDPTPWDNRKDNQDITDPDYIKIFGPRPSGPSTWKLQVAIEDWEYNRRQFFGIIAIPEDYPVELVNESKKIFEAWTIPQPVYYEHKIWGKMGRFVGSPVPELDLPIYFMINYPHHAVSTYQIRNFIDNGFIPLEWHPFVPMAYITKHLEK